MKHNFKPGDIFVSSWGYNMTIVDFYQVTRKTHCGVYVRQVEQNEEIGGYLSGETMPKKDTLFGE